jgi:hypothetical protein
VTVVAKAAWRSLRVGDRIRFVRVPKEFDRPDFVVQPDTRRLFELLVQRGRAHRIAWIDDWGVPYIDLQFRVLRGRRIYERLGILEDCWVRVRSTRPRRSKPSGR